MTQPAYPPNRQVGLRTTGTLARLAVLTLLAVTALPTLATAQRTFGTLVVVEAEPLAAGPSPLSAQTPADWRFVEMVYAPLYVESRSTAEPWLAQSLQVQDDGRKLVVALKEAAAWSDGRTIKALDVVYTYELARIGKWNRAWVDQLEPIEKVERAPNGFDVVVHLKRPVRQPERLLTVPIIPSGLHGSLTDENRQRPLPTGVLGAGAYKPAKEGVTNQLIVNEHSLLKPKISEIRFLDAGSRDAAAAYVRVMGDAVTFALAPGDAAISRDEFGSGQLRKTRRHVVALAWTDKNKHLTDPVFRSAVLAAIDRTELFASGERGRPSLAPIPRSSPDYPKELTAPPRDAIEARKILWYSGWERDVDERHFSRKLEAGQTEFAEITVLVDADDDEQMRRATILRERLAEAGIEMELDARPHIEFQDRIRSREFPAALVSMPLDGARPLRSLFHSKGGANITNFVSSTVDAALDAGDRAAAAAAIAAQAPMIFLGITEDTGAAGRNVRVPFLSGRGGMSRIDRWQIR